MARMRCKGDPDKRSFLVDGGASITAGEMVMLNSDGHALTAAALAGATAVVGIAKEDVDNSAGGDGDLSVAVDTNDVFLLDATSIAQVSVGAIVYASDGSTVDETQGANEVAAGILQEVVSATQGWVAIEYHGNRAL